MSGNWKTAAEWASLELKDLPRTKSGLVRLAKREAWQAMGQTHARKRRESGGGWEYHVSCLPEAAQADYRRREAVAAAETQIAERASTDVVVAETKSTDLNARCRRAMEARASVLREVDRRMFVQDTTRRQAILSFIADVSWDLKCVKEGRSDQRVLTPELLQAACDANDRGKSRKDGSRKGPSRTQIYNWIKAYEAEGVTALAPEVTRQKQGYPDWLKGFLRFYARPQEPTIAKALENYAKSPDRIGDVPSYDQVKRALKALKGTADYLDAYKGREGPLALKARLGYVTRTIEGMEPGTIYTGDGKTFDAEVQHPTHGKPFRPEITTILDVATRKAVGWSVGLDENAELVADALRYSFEQNGICAIFYTDLGKGYKNKRISMTETSLCARLGVSPTNSIACNSQARGVIERANGSIWNKLSKEYPSYMGKDMDREAAKKYFRESRKSLVIIENEKNKFDEATQRQAQIKYSRLVVSWPQFLDDVAAAIEEYNNSPHEALKFRDPETGRMRKGTPNEVWAQFEATGFKPFMLDEGETDDLYRPYVKRKTRRSLVTWNDNEYFSLELEKYHGEYVFLGYDIHNADKVWIREIEMLDGKEILGAFICTADFGGNRKRYVPLSQEQKAIETRAKNRKRLLNKRLAEVDAEAAPQITHQPSMPIDTTVRERTPVEVEDAILVSETPASTVVNLHGSKRPKRDPRNPWNNPDIGLAWDIVDAVHVTPIPPNHIELMEGLLRNPTAVAMMIDVSLPLGELQARLEAASQPPSSSRGA